MAASEAFAVLTWLIHRYRHDVRVAEPGALEPDPIAFLP
jgi:hypothetical protein